MPDQYRKDLKRPPLVPSARLNYIRSIILLFFFVFQWHQPFANANSSAQELIDFILAHNKRWRLYLEDCILVAQKNFPGGSCLYFIPLNQMDPEKALVREDYRPPMPSSYIFRFGARFDKNVIKRITIKDGHIKNEDSVHSCEISSTQSKYEYDTLYKRLAKAGSCLIKICRGKPEFEGVEQKLTPDIGILKQEYLTKYEREHEPSSMLTIEGYTDCSSLKSLRCALNGEEFKYVLSTSSGYLGKEEFRLRPGRHLLRIHVGHANGCIVSDEYLTFTLEQDEDKTIYYSIFCGEERPELIIMTEPLLIILEH